MYVEKGELVKESKDFRQNIYPWESEIFPLKYLLRQMLCNWHLIHRLDLTGFSSAMYSERCVSERTKKQKACPEREREQGPNTLL